MIYEQHEEETMILEGEFDIAVPFSLAVSGPEAEPKIRVYPSLRPQAEEFVEKFNGRFFSGEAIAWAVKAFGGFLTEHGFEIGEESEDYFINYRLEKTSDTAVQPFTRRIGRVGKLQNLTGYDIDALEQFECLCFATVIDGKIVSAACTNSPVTEDMEGGIEIGVETVPEFGGKGYGTSNAAALASELASRGCTALYECASRNTASMKLIAGLGGVEYAKNYYVVGIRAE
jgi:hypothetical protein